MKDQFSRAKGFSEILDHTFQLCKRHFSTFFLIFLIILGPVFLLEALFLMASGTSFFRQMGSGSNWFEQILSGYDESLSNSAGSDYLIGFVMLALTPIGYAAVLFAIIKIRNDEKFTAGTVIKKGFSRFWPLFGSSIIIAAILIGIIIVVALFITIPGVIMGMGDPLSGIILGIVLFLVIGLAISLLFTRWSFYLGTIVFEEGFPGFAESWRLTKKHTWRIFFLFLIVILITTIVGGAIEAVFTLILGNSVLHIIIVDLVAILTSMITAVAYAVIYFDLKLRQDGDDLREMIDDYQNN
ncbi:hypothetical protein CIL05_16070 [Virgibacillus profundi]|uniref:Glycerophosphoryl diester phosphodiesterase membrane domain-containing protein n=1 Tax=Virgibacillus profundi TaxID=2024555 RepID=A0A2A2IAY9_9BACI|nr:hypothetical protein [Virgibacillus profundi]PAV28454.1 hypothetical protein CIL05_16070 [Virgibacillus profundi]PXY52627.1 hypothetical protein CIT14_16215 [Virgibacillus profundi]